MLPTEKKNYALPFRPDKTGWFFSFRGTTAFDPLIILNDRKTHQHVFGTLTELLTKTSQLSHTVELHPLSADWCL